MSLVEPSPRSGSAFDIVKIIIGTLAGVTGAWTAVVSAMSARSVGPSSLPGYGAAAVLALLLLASVLLVTLGRGYGWARLPLAALLWILLAIQCASPAISEARSPGDWAFLAVLAALNLIAALTLHSQGFNAWLARAGAARARRFGEGFEWVLASGVCAMFATAASGAAVVPLLLTLGGDASSISPGSRFAGGVAGAVLASAAVALLLRARALLAALLALDLAAAVASLALVAAPGARGFSIVVAALAAAGLLASRQRGFALFLSELSARQRKGPFAQ